MAQADDHLAELLRLPVEVRAKAARTLLDSIDDDDDDINAEASHTAELVRRMNSLDSGQTALIDASEARARVLARLRAVRGQ